MRQAIIVSTFLGVIAAAGALAARGAATSLTAAAAPRHAPATRAVASRSDGGVSRPAGPLDLIPAESLLAWKGLPPPDLTPRAQQSSDPWTVMLQVGMRLFQDTLDRKARLTLDLFQSFGEVVRHPFALALIDARAKPTGKRPGSQRVDQLRLALVIRTGGDNAELMRMVQRVVSRNTDAGQARLAAHDAGRWKYQELFDKRLPEWSVVAWGALDEYFVITLGRDVWPAIAAVARGERESVSRDAWVSLIRSKNAREPLIEIIVAAKAIRERLDPFVDGRATRFFQAWNTADVDQVHWAFGFEGRSLYCRTNSRRGDLTRRMVYAGEVYATPRLLATVPAGATYAIYRVSVASFLPKLIESYYATRSPDDRVAAEKRWARVESELGLDAERDALALLGNNIVLHNFPQHPFHMPLAFTSLIEIEREPQRVRETLEKLCRAWKDALQKEADEKGVVNPAILFRDDDGVWFLRVGPVAGLSWTFTDRYIVTSWSPHALREYLAKAADAVGSRD